MSGAPFIVENKWRGKMLPNKLKLFGAQFFSLLYRFSSDIIGCLISEVFDKCVC